MEGENEILCEGLCLGRKWVFGEESKRELKKKEDEEDEEDEGA